MKAEQYDHQAIEQKWQQEWEKKKVWRTQDISDRPKKYVLDMFPFLSGAGLHVGHPEGYTATDIISRCLRMQGRSVLHTMGWDAFGLPTENAAIKKGVHPKALTKEYIANFKKQIQSIGFSYDWDREINTSDPKYYRWTQWIFLQLFKQGLAYEKEAPIWWCPKDKTGLANEEVVNGRCERCGSVVERKMLRQWMLKITAYAERLLSGLDQLDWPEGIKELQRNWIGRSEGAEVRFKIKDLSAEVSVFTTRPDTLFGATYLVLAPEHGLVDQITTTEQKQAVEVYKKKVGSKSDLERTALGKEKTGVFTGAYAINPANNEKIPIWIADYVLKSYGTGAIMAVPGHDERDLEFAKKFNLPVRYVVLPRVVDAKNPPRPNKPTVARQNVQAIIFDPNTEKFLCLKRKDQPWVTFVIGGVEPGEDALQAAEREIAEETGYENLEFVRQLGGPIQAEYFATHKDENRIAEATAFLFHLKKGKPKKISNQEQAQHEIIWRSIKEITPQTMNCSELPFWMMNLQHEVAHTGEGLMRDSGQFTGVTTEEGRQQIVEFLQKENKAKLTVNYKLRDWIFSRQRYWGEPIPLVHCPKDGVVPVPEDQLPVLLPDVEKYEPTGTGESPLANVPEWVKTTCPKCGGPAKRETNTMPQWAGSCWYYLRFVDPHNDQVLADPTKQKAWLPVDIYVGGAEHAVLHLLYSRFWHKVLFDVGAIPKECGDEPFIKLRNVGLILGEDGEKMSKSRGNVVNPDDIIAKFGADSFRMYEMFMGPFEDAKPWQTNGIIGVRRFLEKVWQAKEKVKDATEASPVMRRHLFVRSLTMGIEEFQFNTCISDLMKWSNAWKSEPFVSRQEYEDFLKVLSPFAPHVAEELWHQLGHKTLLAQESWPEYDPAKTQADTVTIAVQVNGKHRGNVTVPTGSNESVVREAAEAEANVKKYLTGTPKKVIYVKDRLLSYVV